MKFHLDRFQLLAGGLVVVLMALILCTYFWQHGKVISSKSEASSLTTKYSNLSIENKKLSQQLNNANKAISSLSQGSNFTSGAPCQTQQLILSAEQNQGGAAGSAGWTFSYQNTSTSPCSISGYPGFLALDSTGHVMPDGPVTTSGEKPQVLTLNPLAKAYFLAYWPAHDAVGTENGCVVPSIIESTPPGNHLPLAISTNSIGDICGTPAISPLTLTTTNNIR